jgi:hypothetical protein
VEINQRIASEEDTRWWWLVRDFELPQHGRLIYKGPNLHPPQSPPVTPNHLSLSPRDAVTVIPTMTQQPKFGIPRPTIGRL